MARLLPSILLVAAAGCSCDEGGPDGTPDGGADGDGGTDGGGDGGVGDFTFVVESSDVGTEDAIVEITSGRDGSVAVRRVVPIGEDVTLTGLAPGRHGLFAWADLDGDEAWDGAWEGEGEPTARLGVELPRGRRLRIPLRRGMPVAVIDGRPRWVDLSAQAFDLATEHVAAGTAANGFADHYLDEAFSDQIFQWDSCFMTQFARTAADALPVMGTLDNFYGIQQPDGYICRVANESDGRPGGDASDPSEPMLNPPLFGWAELEWLRQTGDPSRLSRVVPILDRYHDWIDAHVRTRAGLYYTSMLGSGMDNAPRETAFDGWVDMTAQQAFGRRVLGELSRVLGDETLAREQDAEADRICDDVRRLFWDDGEGFFFDLDADGALLSDKTLAGIWPLVAGCATPEQVTRVAEHLRDPSEFWRVHPFPSVAADSPRYDPRGHYWRGGVWAPTNYATITALSRHGWDDLARAAAERHLDALAGVWDRFVPDPAELAPEETGDGRHTLWELYAPDAVAPGTRWDAQFLGRQRFVGWTGLGPIALLFEQIVGLEANALSDTLTFRVGRSDRHGVMAYRFGDQLVDLVARERVSADAPLEIDVTTSDPFTLVVVRGGERLVREVPVGSSTIDLGPPGSAQPEGRAVPAGPFPGTAILGNGRLVAVWTDQDGSADPPGLAHLYLGDFGLDLAEGGRTRAFDEVGAAVRPRWVGLDPFFAPFASCPLPGGGALAFRTVVGDDDAVIVAGSVRADTVAQSVTVVPHVTLRAAPDIDGLTVPTTIEIDADRSALLARFSDGTALALGAQPPPASWQAGQLDPDALADALANRIDPGREMALSVPLTAEAGEELGFVWALAAGTDPGRALAALDAALARADPIGDVAARAAAFAPDPGCAEGAACAVAAANLWAAHASTLGGDVPADLTGQFVTSGHPQLYPRDALMVARVLAEAGLADEAWAIVARWLDAGRARPAAGEWYARYDARGRAVDAGSGARFDVPEWDSQGYLAVLVERLGPERPSGAQRSAVLEALDALLLRQDAEGLFTEGGIVEWVGRLPATTMTSWAGLDAGARLADAWGEPERAAAYRAAAGRARGGLLRLEDGTRGILADERDGGFGWDSSLVFGPLWGFPPGPPVMRTVDWLLAQARGHGGGMRYFEGNEYGGDLFFFTTSGAAEVLAGQGRTDEARELVDWMLAFTNRYGLAPERVYLGGSGASPASPLTWCAAELAQAVRVTGAPVPSLAVDGAVTAAEYAPRGLAVVDADGLPDTAADPVVVWAALDGGDLFVGLPLAGPTREASGASFRIWLVGSGGTGPSTATASGARLTFRADPEATPGATTWIDIALGPGACTQGDAGVPCDDFAVGDRAIELRVDAAALGLDSPVQLVVEHGEPGTLLPPHGSLATREDETVLVGFEVDATSVADRLDPDRAVVVTLSGDRDEIGAWRGDALGLADDGLGLDELAGDGVWTTVVRLVRGGTISYKYAIGVVGDGSWDGVEFGGDDRVRAIPDLDGSGRMRLRDAFGVRGGVVTDP